MKESVEFLGSLKRKMKTYLLGQVLFLLSLIIPMDLLVNKERGIDN